MRILILSQNQAMEFSPIIIGTMRLGVWGAKFNTSQLEYFIDACLDMGLKDFDHADIYGHYTTEAQFGEVFKRRPDLISKCQITTKCGIHLVCKERPNLTIKSYDSSAEHILWSAENSIKELGVEALDLLLIHRPDYLSNFEEIGQAFKFLKSKGMVKEFGVSNYNVQQFDLLNKEIPLITNQIETSIIHRNPFEDGVLNQCMAHKIRPTAWSCLGGGTLFSKSKDPIINAIQKVGKALGEKYNASLDQILLAWVLKHPSQIIPVLGTSNIERVTAAKAALKINLSRLDWYQLWEAAIGKEVA